MGIIRNGEVAFKNAVFREYERNGYHDSYFFAYLWDAEAGKIDLVEWGATAYGGPQGCAVDADEAAYAAAGAWARGDLTRIGKLRAEQAAVEPAAGDRVEVVKGRKFAKGRTGLVIGNKVMTYRHKPYANGNVDIKTYKVWVQWEDVPGMDQVDVKNLQVLNVERKIERLQITAAAKVCVLDDRAAVEAWINVIEGLRVGILN